MPSKVLVIGNNTQVQKMFYSQGYEVILDENRMKKEPDLVCFTGGSDVSPSLYGEGTLPKTHANPMRDAQETKYFELFRKKPKVGICRGGQFLNVMCGGALWQDVSDHATGYHQMEDLVNHKKILVTSTHHQMMIPHEDGLVLGVANICKNFESYNRDREIPTFDTEVVFYDEENSLCFQPHPETGTLLRNPNAVNECREFFFELVELLFE